MKLGNRMLTAAFVRRAPAGRHGDGRDGHGLILLVRKLANGRISRVWIQRVRIGGRPTHLGLGRWPEVSLSEARAAALANARSVTQGHDPRSAGIPTFKQAVEKVIALHSGNWTGSRTAAQWRSNMRDYAYPTIGDKRVSDVTTADVMAILMPVWNARRSMAERARQRIGVVMKWAVAQGYRPDNPAGEGLTAALPRNGGTVEHRKAIHHAEVAAAVEKIRGSGAAVSTRLALEFLVLTAVRSGEVRGAKWTEIDMDERTWTIPAARMKMSREHRVPLSEQAVAVLREAASIAEGSGLIFPSVTGRLMSDAVLLKLVRETGIDGVVHGFRSSFRDWAGDTGQPRELAEMALAHAVRGVEGAYLRSDLFERWRALMNAWSAYRAKPNS